MRTGDAECVRRRIFLLVRDNLRPLRVEVMRRPCSDVAECLVSLRFRVAFVLRIKPKPRNLF